MDIFEWDENTPVTTNNLNEMQHTINRNIIDRYSTSEIKTNKIWINDKPIYRQVLKSENFAIPTTSSYLPSALKPTNESDIEEITYTEVLFNDSDYNGIVPAQIAKVSDGIKIKALDSWGASYSRYITIIYEYTKISD